MTQVYMQYVLLLVFYLSRFFSLSYSFSLSPSFYLSLYLSLSRFFSLSFSFSLSISPYLSHYLSILLSESFEKPTLLLDETFIFSKSWKDSDRCNHITHNDPYFDVFIFIMYKTL